MENRVQAGVGRGRTLDMGLLGGRGSQLTTEVWRVGAREAHKQQMAGGNGSNLTREGRPVGLGQQADHRAQARRIVAAS